MKAKTLMENLGIFSNEEGGYDVFPLSDYEHDPEPVHYISVGYITEDDLEFVHEDDKEDFNCRPVIVIE